MEKISCINCSKVITREEHLKYNIQIARDKVKIVFGDVASCNVTEKNPLCGGCFSAFNTLFNTRLEFNSRTDPDSKINKIRYGNPKPRKMVCSSRIENSFSKAQTTELAKAKETEENDYILPFIDDEVHDDHMSEDIICLSSDDYSNETPEPLVEFQEKFLHIKIKKLPTNPSLTSALADGNALDIKYCCFECGRCFSSEELLTNHHDAAHEEKFVHSFKCNFCERKFVHFWFYRNHLDTCHNGIEIQFSCIVCEKRFKSQKELNDHKSTHRFPFKCKYCPTAYEHVKEIQLLRKHLMEFHENTAEAKAAAFNEKYIKESPQFARNLNGNENRKCFECEKSFEGVFGCLVHKIFDHYNERRCSVCKLEFMCSDDLKKHLEEMPGHELNYCTLCGRKFGSIEKLLTHMYRIHGKNMKYDFVCESCGKCFCFFDSLCKHYKLHFQKAGPPPPSHIRKKCGKKFGVKSKLKSHMTMTTHKNPYISGKAIQCNICNKRFYGQSDLDLHNSKEHDVVDFSVFHKCPESGCEFSCRTSLGLHCHQRTHLEASSKKKDKLLKIKNSMNSQHIEIVKTFGYQGARRKYKCNMCKDVFKSPNYISIHLYTKHSIILSGFDKSDYLNCKSCAKIFVNKSSLQKHVFDNHRQPKMRQSKVVNLLRKRFTCHLCPCEERFDGVDELRYHFKNAHPGSEEANNAAKNEKRSQEDAKTDEKHLTRSQTDIYCIYCRKIFNSILETDHHNKTVHKAQPVCKLCQHICENEMAYINHEATHTEFPCVQCNSNFSSMQEFCTHLQDAHVRFPYICEMCGTYISTLTNLMKHYKIKHTIKMRKGVITL